MQDTCMTEHEVGIEAVEAELQPTAQHEQAGEQDEHDRYSIETAL